MATKRFQVAFDIEPTWYVKQCKLARSGRPPGGARIRKADERLLIGYVDGVLILAFPYFQVSLVCQGSGEGWFSMNPHRLGELLTASPGPVRVTVDSTTLRLNRFETPHHGVSLRLGSNDPELPALAARIDELAAEECRRRLLAAGEEKEKVAEAITWHRAECAANSAPLLEQIREGSLIVYRVPKTPTALPSKRAVVDRKQITADKAYLLCHDFHGNEITVDPRWVTLVGW